ncbi:MAG: TetR/AcrR family transcriptional regulator [Chloroflexia bacterium]|jgi:AcrR family transcriptional regulator|nr:TetR/AcrR family transcriptional regulator [Chloroflexia bacterium]MDQ3613760.1 TetR/AcrR family transcriptional regulator [Chloroflexota bacterium]
MGNREALLDGAMRCLYEKGYAHTSARDIATASGVSLAAIGYHFGTKEALLNAALVEAIGEWGDELGRALATVGVPDAGSVERFEAIWSEVIESFATHRSLWFASFESFAQIDRVPEVRRILAEGMEQGRLGLGPLFRTNEGTDDERTARAVGSFYHALMTGVLAQWLTDPERAPSASDLALALRAIAADVDSDGSAEHE